MNEPRYQELVGRVLDDEFSPVDLEELTQALHGEPGRLADFQFHLVLWELFAQQRQRERGAEAFVAAWHTRLAAESQAATFVEKTIERIETGGVSQPSTLSPMPPLSSAPAGQIRSGRGFSELLRAAWARLNSSALAFAAGVALVVGLGVWYFSPTVGQPVLADVQGFGLSLERAGQALPATPGTRLQPGDVLRTPGNGTAAISFLPEKTRIVLNPGSEFKLASNSRGKRFALHFGKLESSVARQRPFQPMVITTPQAEATVVGTAFTLSTTTNSTRLDVAEGKVRFTRLSDGAAVKVPADHYAIAANVTELAALPQTGGILREWWTNVSDQTMHDFRGRGHVRFPRAPDAWDVARAFALESVKTNRLAVRFRGYLHPPVTGDYQVWLTGPADTALGETVLLVSPSEDAEDATPIARTGTRTFNQSPPPFPLMAGRRYYLEALIFIEKGEGHLSLEWKQPAGSRELLTGEFLSPLKTK